MRSLLLQVTVSSLILVQRERGLVCTIPEVPQNVHLLMSNQSALAYECTSYHVLHSGSLLRMCKNGTWTGNAPHCVIDSILPKPYLVLLITGVTILLFLVCIPIDFYRYRKRKNECRQRQARMALIARIAPYHVVLVSEPAPAHVHAFSRRKMGLRSLFTFFRLMKDARSRTELRATQKGVAHPADPACSRGEPSTSSGGLELSEGVYLHDKNGDVRFGLYRSTARTEEALRQQMANGAYAASLPSTSQSVGAAKSKSSSPSTAKDHKSNNRPAKEVPARSTPELQPARSAPRKEEVKAKTSQSLPDLDPVVLNQEKPEKKELSCKAKVNWKSAYELMALKKPDENSDSETEEEGEETCSPRDNNSLQVSSDVIRPCSLDTGASATGGRAAMSSDVMDDVAVAGKPTAWGRVRRTLLGRVEMGRGRCELDTPPSPAFSTPLESDMDSAVSPVDPGVLSFYSRNSSSPPSARFHPPPRHSMSIDEEDGSIERGKGRKAQALRWAETAGQVLRGDWRVFRQSSREREDWSSHGANGGSVRHVQAATVHDSARRSRKTSVRESPASPSSESQRHNVSWHSRHDYDSAV